MLNQRVILHRGIVFIYRVEGIVRRGAGFECRLGLASADHGADLHLG